MISFLKIQPLNDSPDFLFYWIIVLKVDLAIGLKIKSSTLKKVSKFGVESHGMGVSCGGINLDIANTRNLLTKSYELPS